MSHSAGAPSLTIVAGTTVSAPPKSARKARARTPAERDAKIVAAGEMIERLLPAYAELNRALAKGAREAHAHCDATFGRDKQMAGDGPAAAALASIYKSSGADTAQAAMNVLFKKIAPLARMIEDERVETVKGMRAKTLAAIWRCFPGLVDQSGFDFDNQEGFEMLFRACVRLTGLSHLKTEIEARLQIDVEETPVCETT